MEKTVRFFRESMSNRLNDDESAIIVCMQRLRDNDVSGDILAREVDYCHLMTQSPVPRKGGIITRILAGRGRDLKAKSPTILPHLPPGVTR